MFISAVDRGAWISERFRMMQLANRRHGIQATNHSSIALEISHPIRRRSKLANAAHHLVTHSRRPRADGQLRASIVAFNLVSNENDYGPKSHREATIADWEKKTTKEMSFHRRFQQVSNGADEMFCGSPQPPPPELSGDRKSSVADG